MSQVGYFRNHSRWAILQGDNRQLLRGLSSNSVDSMVTDPPAGIAFMGKDWDRPGFGLNTYGGALGFRAPRIGANSGNLRAHFTARDLFVAGLAETMREALRVLKPGAHGLVWALPKTSHWTGAALELAGFEVRDRISHFFGTGMPKNRNLSKDIDRIQGYKREVVGKCNIPGYAKKEVEQGAQNRTKLKFDVLSGVPLSRDAKKWEGWGTALRPAVEDWWLVRKPMHGTIAANLLANGVGGLNIDGCRISRGTEVLTGHGGKMWSHYRDGKDSSFQPKENTDGNWPAHLLISHSTRCVVANKQTWDNQLFGEETATTDETVWICADDCPSRMLEEQRPGAVKFFYCPKPTAKERNAGCYDLPLIDSGEMVGRKKDSPGAKSGRAGAGRTSGAHNTHPTIKAIALCRYLARLITPPQGLMLDPYAGSGSIGCGAVLEGFRYVGMEQDPHYCNIARHRLRWWSDPENA